MDEDVLDAHSALSTSDPDLSPGRARLDKEKKKSKKKNPFKKLASIRSSFKKQSRGKSESKRPSSLSEVHLGDSLANLTESPGSSRRQFLRDTKAKSLDLGGDGVDSFFVPPLRARSVELSDDLGSNSEIMSGKSTSPMPTNGDLRSSEERRSRSEDPDSVESEDRLVRGSTPQIMVTAPEGADSQGNNVKKETMSKLPKPGMKYKLVVDLISGTGLAVRDRSGTSDPYVKFRTGTHRAKSSTIFKNLNPVWNEVFVLEVDDVDDKLKVKVYDYDFGLRDDFMGYSYVDLSELPVGESHEQRVYLEDQDNEDEDLGFLTVKLKLLPEVSECGVSEDVQDGQQTESVAAVQRSSTTQRPRSRCPSVRKLGSLESHAKRSKSQLWKNVLNVVLLNGKSLPAMDDNGFSDPYCKFKIGSEKFKSKVCSKTLNPEWKEQFDLHVFEDHAHVLEIEVWDRDYGSKDDFMGRCSVDLDDLTPEETHRKTLELKDCESGEITVLLTVSGTAGHAVEDTDCSDGLLGSAANYSMLKTLKNVNDIGCLRVKVLKAAGLQAADFGGTSDPFVVLELGNARVRTETVYKTVEPAWEKAFTLKVKDIHSLLEVTVFDEDKHRNEFLGRLVIPLLSIEAGVRKWYQLKDRKLGSGVKGEIQLELDVVYNPVRASIRTFNPKEAKYLSEEEKFKRQLLVKNVQRVANLVRTILTFWRWIQSLFEWESKFRSLIAFIVFLVVTWYFDWWMPFALLLLIFMYQYIAVSNAKGRRAVITTGCIGSVARRNTTGAARGAAADVETDESSGDDSDPKSKEGKMSLMKKFQAIMDVCQTVQNVLDTIASFGERVKNTFNWTVPFLSWLAVVVLTLAMIIFYLVPPRYLVLAWGINKFTKRLRKPNFIPNNELVDFLSRIPSDQELVQWCEAKPGSIAKKIKKK